MMGGHVGRDEPIYYGKGAVTFYRTYARPLRGVPAIPESPFTGADNVLFAADVTVLAFGDAFWPAYAEGDNAPVVATDSMKNFIQRHAARYEGCTLEGFLEYVGRQLLLTYPQMSAVRLTAHELPFAPVPVPRDGGFSPSPVLFERGRGAHAVAEAELDRGPDGEVRLASLRGGVAGLHLVKITGNSFTGFVRDEYTTLPEAEDRALFIHLDATWSYAWPEDGLGRDPSRYVAAPQVAGVVAAVFHELYTRSIQHLLYHAGMRLMERFPQLAEIRLQAENRSWDEVAQAGGDPPVRVYADPRPPYGIIGLTLRRQGGRVALAEEARRWAGA